MKSLVCILTALVLVNAVHGQLASLQIDSVSPPGAQAGTTLTITLGGQDLDELSALTFAHPGITAKHLDGSRFELTIGADVPADNYEVRVAGRFGLSNARPFEVSSLPQVNEADNQSPEKAMTLALNTYVNGTATAEIADYYKFAATKGQRVFVECLADRLDSRMDATLILADANGVELARDRDSYGHDPFIDFTAPADGDYVVAIHDFQFQGSANHYYRLVLNAGAHVDYVFPPSGTPGKRERFSVFGRNLPEGQATQVAVDGVKLERVDVEIDVPSKPDRLLSRAVAAVHAQGTSLRIASAHRPAPLALAEAPVIVEREPNQAAKNAQFVSVPCELGGQLYPSGDDDWFEFDARKDQSYWIEMFSERLGDPTDTFLVVQKVTHDGEGKEVSNTVIEGDDIDEKVGSHIFPAKSRDSRVTFKADASARYRVLVRDQFAGSDPRHTYRLVIREPRPDFSLVVGTRQPTDEGDQLSRATSFLRRDGSRQRTVMAQRRDGFNGPINVTVASPPAGVVAQPCTIPSGQNEATLTLTANADAPDFVGSIQVHGEAEIAGTMTSRTASGVAVLWGVGNWKQEYTLARLCREVPLAVSGVELVPIALKPVEDKVYEASLAGKLEIPLQLAKRDGIKDKAAIRPIGLPGLAKPKDFQIDNNAKDAKLIFDFTKKDGNNFKPGEYTIYAQTKGKMNYRANPEAQTRAEAAKKEKDEAVAKVETDHKSADERHKGLTNEIAELNQKISDQALTSEEGAKQMAEKQKALEEVAVARETKAKELEVTKQAQAAAEAKLKQATDRAKPQEKKFLALSKPIHLRIVPSPVKLVDMPQPAVKPESQVEVPVKIERLFGYNEVVELSVNIPDASKGVQAQPVSIPKDASEAKLVLTVAKDTAPGEKEVRVDAKVKLNGEELVVSRNLKIRVEG